MKAIIKFLTLLCLVIPVHVFAAATITINVTQSPYNNVNSAQNVGVISTVEERNDRYDCIGRRLQNRK